MVEYFLLHIWMIWAVVAFVCLIMEMTSGDFFITCFGIGALCAMGVSLTPAPFWLQVVAFAVFSVLSIYFLRPRLVAMLNAKANHRVSNADAIIGRVGEVSESVKAGGYGRVKLDGDDWKAESDAVNDIPVGARVRIIGRESIIVKVEPVA